MPDFTATELAQYRENHHVRMLSRRLVVASTADGGFIVAAGLERNAPVTHVADLDALFAHLREAYRPDFLYSVS